MQSYEKLGVFYLGRAYDLAAHQLKDDLVLYDSKDLLTHAVCVGMTGSGKTGLCIDIIEEAAIDGIPAVVVDPKGDLADLLLTFPGLQAGDFRPWINEDEARNQGVTPDQYAEQQAAAWRRGLADWDQDGARIERLRNSAEFAIYTPASNAGRQVSILKSFAAPPQAVLDDGEAMRERVSATASSLLSLAGIEADPMQSREHILLATILDRAWRSGADLDLAAVIQQVQQPPVTKIGVLDLESFYPSKDRFGLTMQLNNLLASPGFEAWLQGEPLDLASLLRTPEGKPRVVIFSIAHLNDHERMFFVSLLLNQTLLWMRTQSGTTSLRALFYMDEIFGYFPPVANPPSKLPLLTLLKQARAFGLGVVLATQNPVDLDYKGLANAGTWLIGRLQTERDKARLLDGLEGAAASTGSHFDRARIDAVLAGLGSRVFLMNNVHDDAPLVFQSRWSLSYLRGPLTRQEIKRLTAASPAAKAPEAAAPAPPAAQSGSPSSGSRPVLPPDIQQQFAPAGKMQPPTYRPLLLGAAQVRFLDARTKIDVTRDVVYTTAISNEAVPVDWAAATPLQIELSDLEPEPAAGARFLELSAAASKARNYAAWTKAFTAWLAQSERIQLLRSPSTGAISNAGEAERDFRARIQHAAREERDQCAEDLRKKYAPKIATLEERLRRAQQAVERESEQASAQTMNTAISVGATLLGAFLGRKSISRSTLGRATTAARSASRTLKETNDVRRAGETVDAIQQQLNDLNAQFQRECDDLESHIGGTAEQLETIEVRPKKTGITTKLVCLTWVPM